MRGNIEGTTIIEGVMEEGNSSQTFLSIFQSIFMLKSIGVIGGSSCNGRLCELAYRVGYLIGKSGALLVTGGLGGVMLHACRGAKDAGGLTLGILPWGKEEANPYVDIGIPTHYGLARNHLVVRASDVLIAIDGFIGTLSEISFALNEGKTVISLESWHLEKDKISRGKYIEAENAEEAINLALRYLNMED